MPGLSRGSRISAPGAGLALLAFFLPWADLSCSGVRMGSVSGYQAASGFQTGFGTVGGDSRLFLFPLAALVCLALPFLFASSGRMPNWASWTQIGLVLAPFILLLSYLGELQGSSQSLGVQVTAAIGFWLTIVGFAAVGAGAFLDLSTSPPEQIPISPGAGKEGGG